MKDLKDLDSFAFSSPALLAQNLPKAKTIVLSALKQTSHQPKEVLSVTESWASLLLREQGLNVTLLSETSEEKKYDTIIAFDEVMCRYRSEQAQKQSITSLMNFLSPNGLALVSLRDYRNGHFHRRPLGDTVLNDIDGEEFITVEVNQHDAQDKQSWNQKMYLIKNHMDFSVIHCGDRRTLYFKQMAKYCSDAGFKNFGVFKDIFWRGTWRRTPEHIAWVKL